MSLWASAAWQAEALSWIDSELTRAGRRRTGLPGDPRLRSWASVTRIPTDGGIVWFKAAAPVTAHEIAIYPLLSRLGPDAVLAPIATDPDRSWMLLPDGGISLRHTASGDDLVHHLERIVPVYARLQRALMPEVAGLLACGVPDRRPRVMPRCFDHALDVARNVVGRYGKEHDEQTLSDIESCRDRYLGWCDELAESPVFSSLDHSDLHSNNVLLASPGNDASARFYDWGDSVVAHPFCSMLVLLQSLQDSLQATPDDPRLIRVRDAYLAEFNDLDCHAALVDTMETACRVSRVIRALTWEQVLALDPEPNPDWVTAPFDWMKSVLEGSYLD
jgi:hypothetical protein